MKKRFVVSYSCGKDSTLALSRMIDQGHIPAALLTTVDKSVSRTWFHGIDLNLLKSVSDSLSIPSIIIECFGEEYKKRFEQHLLSAKKDLNIDSCVFGDIDLEAHRVWCTERCDNVGIEAVFPLWEEDREKLTYEVIDKGFKAVIKNVRLDILGMDFLGKTLTKEVVNDIKANGADACGENGEYHTFVYDGPIFKFPIEFEVKGKISNDTHGFLDIQSKQ